MDMDMLDAVVVAGMSVFLVLALCGTLVLVMVSLRRPTTYPLAVATGLVVTSLVIIAVTPLNVPLFVGLILALLGVVIGVLGGNPITRRVLELATGGRVRETADGGILLPTSRGDDDAGELQPLLRGGTTIGYLERLAVVLAVIAGFPEAIAVIVAIKGIGRFSELAEAEARERFIIGTMASLLWACAVGALVRLSIW